MKKKYLQNIHKSEVMEHQVISKKNSEDLVNNEKNLIFPERLDKEKVEKLPVISFKGEIHVIEEKRDIKEALKILRKERVLGFDTETRPNFKKGHQNPVSLLQLSTKNDAFLFRLHLLGLSNELVSLLEDRRILKVGVAILDDIRSLQNLNRFDPGGFIELSNIGKQLGIITCGLQSLAAIFFGVRITKKDRLTNWERNKFKQSQSLYAATDAWICLEMFNFLKNRNLLPKNIFWKMPDQKISNDKTFNKKSTLKKKNNDTKKMDI